MSAPLEGFQPVFDEKSRVLILGSFPSVMSRAVNFYYGNPQNRFWGMLGAFFGEEVPESAEGRRSFVLSHQIALWDVVMRCEIVGSSDASIKNEVTADVGSLVAGSKISRILCNGTKAYALLLERFPELVPMASKLPSTSPANPRYSYAAWEKALSEVFPTSRGDL